MTFSVMINPPFFFIYINVLGQKNNNTFLIFCLCCYSIALFKKIRVRYWLTCFITFRQGGYVFICICLFDLFNRITQKLPDRISQNLVEGSGIWCRFGSGGSLVFRHFFNIVRYSDCHHVRWILKNNSWILLTKIRWFTLSERNSSFYRIKLSCVNNRPDFRHLTKNPFKKPFDLVTSGLIPTASNGIDTSLNGV